MPIFCREVTMFDNIYQESVYIDMFYFSKYALGYLKISRLTVRNLLGKLGVVRHC